MGKKGQVVPRIMVFEDDRSTRLTVQKQVRRVMPQAILVLKDQVYTAALEILDFKPHVIIMDYNFSKHTSSCLIPFINKLKVETYFYTSTPEIVKKECRQVLGKLPRFIHVYSKQAERPTVFQQIKKQMEKMECLKQV